MTRKLSSDTSCVKKSIEQQTFVARGEMYTELEKAFIIDTHLSLKPRRSTDSIIDNTSTFKNFDERRKSIDNIRSYRD